MITFIVDLFHPYPEELGDEGAQHDILGTSEASVQLCLHYKNRHRLYYCDDFFQEEKALKWHAADCLSTRNQLSLIDVRQMHDLVPLLEQAKGNVRLIINGQGNIDKTDLREDSIGGLNKEDFSQALDDIMTALKIDGNQRKLSELIIFSCNMARSSAFVASLLSKFNVNSNGLKLVLFKHAITFSNGKLFSFYDDEGSREDTLENLTHHCASIYESNPKENSINNANHVTLSFAAKRSKGEDGVKLTQLEIIHDRGEDDFANRKKSSKLNN